MVRPAFGVTAFIVSAFDDKERRELARELGAILPGQSETLDRFVAAADDSVATFRAIYLPTQSASTAVSAAFKHIAQLADRINEEMVRLDPADKRAIARECRLFMKGSQNDGDLVLAAPAVLNGAITKFLRPRVTKRRPKAGASRISRIPVTGAVLQLVADLAMSCANTFGEKPATSDMAIFPRMLRIILKHARIPANIGHTRLREIIGGLDLGTTVARRGPKRKPKA
jgi:hypothetical protein